MVGTLSFFSSLLKYLLHYYVQRAEKYAGWLREKFHPIVVGITEMDYAVFILVFVPLLLFIFLVLLSSFARRIQRKYRSGYFKYCKYLLRLPQWYRNHTVVSKFDIVDAPSRLKHLSKDICLKTRQMIGVFDPLWPFFEWR